MVEPVLPLELIYEIIDIHIQNGNTTTLKAISATCQTLRPLCQKTIFKQFAETSSPRLHRSFFNFCLFLHNDEHTHLRNYIRTIKIKGLGREGETAVGMYVGHFPSLSTLVVGDPDFHSCQYRWSEDQELDFETCSHFFRIAVYELINRNTLEDLTLANLYNVPVWLLGYPGHRLHTLRLHRVVFQQHPYAPANMWEPIAKFLNNRYPAKLRSLLCTDTSLCGLPFMTPIPKAQTQRDGWAVYGLFWATRIQTDRLSTLDVRYYRPVNSPILWRLVRLVAPTLRRLVIRDGRDYCEDLPEIDTLDLDDRSLSHTEVATALARCSSLTYVGVQMVLPDEQGILESRSVSLDWSHILCTLPPSVKAVEIRLDTRECPGTFSAAGLEDWWTREKEGGPLTGFAAADGALARLPELEGFAVSILCPLFYDDYFTDDRMNEDEIRERFGRPVSPVAAWYWDDLEPGSVEWEAQQRECDRGSTETDSILGSTIDMDEEFVLSIQERIKEVVRRTFTLTSRRLGDRFLVKLYSDIQDENEPSFLTFDFDVNRDFQDDK